MKITPLSTGQQPVSSENQSNTGTTPDRIARAKAIAAGDHQINIMPSETMTDPQQVRPSVRKIKMRTNVSPDRQEVSVEAGEPAPVIPNSTPSEPNEVSPVVEETKPLDPQFAALAKQRRALQAKERELLDREKALTSQPASVGADELKARLKSDPLSVLQESGVTYDQLTEAILSSQSGITPEIIKLRKQVEDLEKGFEQKLSEKDTQAEQQVLAEIRRDIDKQSAQGDEFEMIRATSSQPEVQELIHRLWKETGEVLDVSEAMQLVEDDLINESLKLANTQKVKSRLTPTPLQQQSPQQKQIRTLTNRDSAAPQKSRRDRAIAAFFGNLKR